METNQKIVEKVKKLLALATSPVEAEAKLAAARAQELLVKYNLTLAQVEKSDTVLACDKKFIHKVYKNERRKGTEDVYVLSLINSFFFVAVVQSKYFVLGKQNRVSGHSFLGRHHNVEIAEFVYDFLKLKFQQLFADYRQKTKCSVTSKKDYYYGLYCGLFKQLTEARNKVQTETGLVVSEESELLEFMRKEFSNLSKSKNEKQEINDEFALQAGSEQGEKMVIARALNGKENGSPQIKQQACLADMR